MKRRLLPIILLLLLLLPSGAWATAFTSNPPGDAGNWNASATWGMAGDPAVEGTDYPGEDDTFAIAAGDTVTVPAGTWPSTGAAGHGYSLAAATEVAATGSLVLSDLAYFWTEGDGIFTVTGDLTAGSAGARKTGHIAFSPATDGGAGLALNGTAAIYGITKDHYALLAADIGNWSGDGDAAYDLGGALIELTVAAIPSGWKDNDLLAIAPTGRTYSHWDTCLLSADAADATLDVDAWQGAAPLYVGVGAVPLWNHQGTGGAGILANARAEVLNLTRSWKIISTDNTKRTYISIATTAVVTMDSVECYSVGYNATGKYGITVGTTTGTVVLTNVVVHDNTRACYAITSITTGTVALTNCIGWYSTGDSTTPGIFWISPMALSGAGACTISNSIAGYSPGAYHSGFYIGDVGIRLPDCRSIGNPGTASTAAYGGFHVAEAAAVADGLLDNVVSHSSGGSGIYWTGGQGTLATAVSGVVSWRNTFLGLNSAGPADVWFSAPSMFGNTTYECQVEVGRVVLQVPTFTADPSFTTTYDCYAYGGNVEILGGTIKGKQNIRGTRLITTIGTTHTTFVSPNWATTADDGQSSALSVWRMTGEDDHRWYSKAMEVRTETGADRRTASGMAYEFWPLTNTIWVKPPSILKFRVPAAADTAITIHVYTKHSVAYDETHPERIVITGGVLQGVTPIGPQACTVTDAGDTVDDVAHGMVNGTEVIFDLTANGLTRGIIYYVVAKAADTFQVSLTVGGAAVPITSNGSNTYTARDIIGEAHSATDDVYEELDSATVTPTETGLLEWYISAYGTVGTVWCDDVSYD